MTEAELKQIADTVAERVAITLLATEIIRSKHAMPSNPLQAGSGHHTSALHEIGVGTRGAAEFAQAVQQAQELYRAAKPAV